MDVVTEGIETKEQVNFVISCGCQIAQGFFYAKPMPVSEFYEFAKGYIGNAKDNHTFRLNGSLVSEDGSMEGQISGQGLYFAQGIFPTVVPCIFREVVRKKIWLSCQMILL